MANAAGPRYTRAEDKFIEECFRKGLGATAIFELDILSGRSIPSIQSRIERLALVKTRRFTLPRCDDEQRDPEEAIRADQKFCEIMHAAIRRGLERAPIGIAKDDTPLVPRRIDSPPMWSGCGSSAGMCADLGSRSSFI